MARVNGGFFGELSGSVGNVTFARSRGGRGAANDLLVGLPYNALQNQAVMVDAGATRGDGQVEVPVPAVWVQDDEDALFAYAFAYRIRGRNQLRLSDSSMKKVNGNPFQAPDVPPTEAAQEVPCGQAAG